ncbi:filamentous hemagglutinin N-terminal domain-containing protein [Rivularia sp. PCC 7116]|uniref:two-partner secretion domain-containing protein n=1 Tax=Rivularia sp. PCC 7116 TaxID=373994 RepID=UPI0012F86885|nr:filamentous hemagglutinin N-terminal domain-containing protein [Rivularia sp. PCC 7116]
MVFAYSTTDARAQNITLDGSLGTPKTLTGPNYQIPQSVGETAGNNLFHSFGKFNLNRNEAAIFESAGNIRNILSRVTGGSPSSIDGLIRTLGSDVNFFLINPSGIIFGENARLDVNGSFVASTANAIQFGEQGFFSATNLQPPSQLLTINPSALFFNQLQPGKIESKSNLRVPNNRSFLLVGGDINLDGGGLSALGGRLELAGLAGNGTVGLNVDGNDLSLNVPDDVARADVSLTNGAIIDVSAGGGGSITVNARNLEVREESQLLAGIREGLGTPEAQAGDITINATDTVLLDNDSNAFNDVNSGAVGNGGDILVTTDSLQVTNGSGLTSNIVRQGQGNGGSIIITTGSLQVLSGGFLGVSTKGTGDADSIIINATGKVIFDGERKNGIPSVAVSDVEPGAVGNAGGVSITTGSLEVTNGAQLSASTFGKGDAGTVTINATNSIKFDGETKDRFSSGARSNVEFGAEGKAGGVSITTGFLEVTNGAELSASTFGKGNAGNVAIKAADSIKFDGETKNGSLGSGAFSQVNSGAVGNAGGVFITTGSLEVTSGAQLSASTFAKGNAGGVNINATSIKFDGEGKDRVSSGVFSKVDLEAVGNAGSISITTGSLEVTNGAELSAATFGKGDAGSVTINATSKVKFDGQGKDGNRDKSQALSTVESGAVGKAGGISITTGFLEVTNGAEINASTSSSGEAGDITLNVSENITLSGSETGIFASTLENSTGKGGSIIIDPKIMTIRDGARIAVDSQGKGIGGDIELAAGFLTLDNGTISAETRSNTGGDITLNLQDVLLLRNGSQITSTAGNQQFGGDGGNISIDVPNGFVVAVPNENSDITANAFSGSGGGVSINATSILGIAPLTRNKLIERLATNNPEELNPNNLSSSDITAVSQQSPDLSREPVINTPDVDPASGLVELPTNLVDASQEIDQACTPRGRLLQSSFIATGRGGLPLSPNEPLIGQAVITKWVDLQSQITPRRIGKLSRQSTTKYTRKIVEAQKFLVDENGDTFLVAESKQGGDSHSSTSPNQNCRVREGKQERGVE